MALKQILKVWDHEFKPNEQSVMLAMADHANEDGTGMWPSNARLAHKTGYSTRNVKRIKRALRKKGVLVKVEDSTHNRPTEYRFNWSVANRKKPFKPNSEGGHSVKDRGDKGGHSVQEGGQVVQSGVTASSPEPSIEPVKETVRGERARVRQIGEKKNTSPTSPEKKNRTQGKRPGAALQLHEEFYPNVRINLYQKDLIRQKVQDLDLWRSTLRYWKGNDYLGRSVQKMLDRYQEEKSASGGFDMAEYNARKSKPKHRAPAFDMAEYNARKSA